MQWGVLISNFIAYFENCSATYLLENPKATNCLLSRRRLWSQLYIVFK